MTTMSNKKARPRQALGIKQIVKVQRPLSGPSHTCLIYAQDRRHSVEMRIPDEVYKVMKRKPGMQSVKAFFWAKWDSETHSWHFDEKPVEAPWQPW